MREFRNLFNLPFMTITDILNIVTKNKHSVFLYTPPIYKDAISYVLEKPKEIITCSDSNLVEAKLKLAETLVQQGLVGFPLFNYELGYVFENKFQKNLSSKKNTPLFTILFYDNENIVEILSSKIKFGKTKKLLSKNKYSINNFKIDTSKQKYIENIKTIKKHIEIGNTYQVNYTVEGKFNFGGSISSLFLSTIFNQSAQFSAFINLEDEFIISNSPELFFRTTKNKIIVKPMKGTMQRGNNILSDLRKHTTLLKSKKNRAENIMIVDLLRNDIGRISKLNTIEVLSKFDIEKYETIFQLTSTIKGELRENGIYSILKNTFPCGSITGAPKIRTMEIIKELEKRDRGIYTGSIGLLKKNSSILNVAIRTIRISKESGKGNIGIGSGIVWDSKPKKEYEETKLKAKFLTHPNRYFELIETMLLENGNYFLLENHLRRLEEAAIFFLFVYKRENILKKLEKLKEKIIVKTNQSFRIKLLLDKWGKVKLISEEINYKLDNLKIKISNFRINSNNKFQYFKTTNREFYDKELCLAKEEGFDDVIFLNEKGQIAEGAISNIFIKIKGKYFTPKIASGILNGVYREYLIKEKDVLEKALKLIDIIEADELYLTNSVRKKIRIREVWNNNKCIIESTINKI